MEKAKNPKESKYISNEGILDNKYILLKALESGYTSTVYKAIDSSNNKECAIKLMTKYDSNLENEILINKKIKQSNSQFFIKYITSSVGYLVKNDEKLFKPYIVLELASKGDIFKYISHNEKGLNEKLSKFFFAKILTIIKSLHNMGICHRDLKLQNFLFVGDNFTLKLSDFGFSSFLIKNKDGKIKLQTGLVGTESYIAPEVLYNKFYDGELADIFSLGVILFNIRTCSLGFSIAKINNPLYRFIKEGKIDKYWEILGEKIDLNGLTEEFKKLYIKMVSFIPSQRPTLEQIYNDEWLKEIRDLNDEEFMEYEKELIEELKSRE